VGIVRISGPAVPSICVAVIGAVPTPRRVSFVRFLDAAGEAIDAGLVLYCPAPRSFTGEDVLELHGHGGQVVTDMLVARALELGARLARPGEFTERAFLNDKIDLAQAEAVADLIDAGSAQAARAAMRSLEGDFSVAVRELTEALTSLRVYVEAAIDFPDEDVEFLASPEVSERIEDIEDRFGRIEHASGQGRLLRDGLSVVISGKPNAGKSSLLNALTGYEAAIVTDVPGTTRDVLRERIHIDGLPVHVVDTAGLRDTSDVVEVEGVRRARGEIERADVVLHVVDSSDPPAASDLARDIAALPADVPVIQVWNKLDLLVRAPERASVSDRTGRPDTAPVAAIPAQGPNVVQISAKTGAGIDDLRRALRERAGYEQGGAGVWSARVRHIEALKRAHGHLADARRRLESRASFELAAEELRLAQRALGEITGAVTSDDLLGRVFASFCLGK
jgi:tRNA modification GTPase